MCVLYRLEGWKNPFYVGKYRGMRENGRIMLGDMGQWVLAWDGLLTDGTDKDAEIIY